MSDETHLCRMDVVSSRYGTDIFTSSCGGVNCIAMVEECESVIVIPLGRKVMPET